MPIRTTANVTPFLLKMSLIPVVLSLLLVRFLSDV